MDKELFSKWLAEKRGLAPKPSQDVVSRCKRIESLLNQKLDSATTSQAAFDAALTGIWRAYPHRNDLMYAFRLFAAFKNPKIDTKHYAFYGDSKTMRHPRKTAQGA